MEFLWSDNYFHFVASVNYIKLYKMGDSWEDEDFEVPTFNASALKDDWDEEVDETQVLITMYFLSDVIQQFLYKIFTLFFTTIKLI